MVIVPNAGKPMAVGKKEQDKQKSNSLVKSEHIIRLQGKEYITHEGLLDVAHSLGLEGITTELLSEPEDSLAVVKATVTMKNGRTFQGIGDAGSVPILQKDGEVEYRPNTNAMIAVHRIRMAETRAVNRALRFATNIGMCSIEELDNVDVDNKK